MLRKKNLHLKILTLDNNKLPKIKEWNSFYKDFSPKILTNANFNQSDTSTKLHDLKNQTFFTRSHIGYSMTTNDKSTNSLHEPSKTPNGTVIISRNNPTPTRSLMNSFKKKLARKRVITSNFLNQQLGYPGNENDWLKISVGRLNYKTIYNSDS